jgi:hypothetical protein
MRRVERKVLFGTSHSCECIFRPPLLLPTLLLFALREALTDSLLIYISIG